MSPPWAWAATAAGGPGAGVAALLIGKIAGKKIDKIAETRYRVTGTLDAPNIERIGREASEEEQDDDFRDPDDHWLISNKPASVLF